MAQLGAGLVGTGQVGYPTVIDTYQTFVNATPLVPDSASRVDAELVMDLLKTLVAVETTLGANVQGIFGSLAARLNQFLPGGGGQPGLLSFTNVPSIAVPGSTHNIGQAALLWQLYDAAIPARAMDPGSVTLQVNPLTYDVLLTFVTPMSGMLALGATTPLYLQPFTAATTVSVLGTTHQLGTADLLFKVYDNGTPYQTAMEPGSLTVHPTTHDVLMTFATPQSGVLVLSTGSPGYATNFTNVSTVSIPGTTHQLGTPALFFQVYNNGVPRAALGAPGLTVNPTTFDVTLTFATPTSGRVILGAASTLSGRDFEIRDAGAVNSAAVRVRSQLGDLYLQAGAGQHLYLQSATGTTRVTVDTQNTRVGIGTATPTHQLELTAADAVMPGGGPWLAPSDERQKEHVCRFTAGLEVVLQLCPVRFRYNGLGGTARSAQEHVGLLAKAVQAIAPYMVRTRPGRLTSEGPETDLLLFDGEALPHLLINAVQELHGWLQTLSTAQEHLRADLDTMQARLQRLEEGTVA